MSILFKRTYLFVILTGLLIHPAVFAAGVSKNAATAINNLNTTYTPNNFQTIADTTAAERDSLLLSDLGSHISQKKAQRSLALYLQKNTLKKERQTKHNARFYYRLAGLFARLRMYPLAMKCYFKTLPAEETPDTVFTKQALASNFIEAKFTDPGSREIQIINRVRDTLKTGIMAFNNRELTGLQADSLSYNGDRETLSPDVKITHIVNPFDDGKAAVAYALLVHVRQPVPGKPKTFVLLNKVGHTFITLIKYNSDSSIVSRSFGFYPRKSFFLSATPLHPSSPAVFKNDTIHNWDETAGKFISARQFKRVLKVIQTYEKRRYNLNNNNCTDFGLTIAMEAGISIKNTKGKWPLGRGNNPANAGQSMLLGNISDTDNSLFLVNDLVKN